MAKRKVKSKQQKLLDKADKLAGDIVRSRGYCELKGKDTINCGGSLQWAHIIGRGQKRLRHETYNALCLCAGHHVYYTHHPHEWFLDTIPKYFPRQWALIEKHRHEPFTGDYEQIIEKLEKELKKSIDL